MERTHEGLEARLKPRGLARFLGAAFLLVWLCGWAAGEGFVVWILWKGALAILAGDEPAAGPLPAAVAVFLLIWLVLWTAGGVAAMRELMRLLWSEDRIVAAPHALMIHRRIGPFRSTREIARPDILSIYGLPRKPRVMAQTTNGPVVLTALASGADRESLLEALRADLGLQDGDARGAHPDAPPPGWRAIIDAEGSPAVIHDPRVRRSRARTASLFTMVVAAAAAWLAARAAGQPRWAALAVLALAAACLLAFGTWRLGRTRLEWRLGAGRLTLRRRGSAGPAREIFEATSLELLETTDSDGDPWFTLDAVASPAMTGGATGRPRRWAIVRTMDDPEVPRRLGDWITARTGIPCRTQGSRKDDPSATIARLEASGPLGRWIAKRLPRS